MQQQQGDPPGSARHVALIVNGSTPKSSSATAIVTNPRRALVHSWPLDHRPLGGSGGMEEDHRAWAHAADDTNAKIIDPDLALQYSEARGGFPKVVVQLPSECH